MNEALRPSTLGEILDRTASLYRSRFLVFFGLAAIPASIVLGAGGGMVLLLTTSGATTTGSSNPSPETLAILGLGFMLLGLVALPLMIGTTALSGAALCHAASTMVLGGTITIAAALKAVWKRGWHYVGLYLLQVCLIFGVPFGVWSVLVMLLAVDGAVAVRAAGAGGGELMTGALMLLMFLGLMAYVVWMLLQIGLAFPVAVVEKTSIGDALKRAWNLCRGTRWRMLALFAMVLVLAWIASLFVTVPLMMLIAWAPGLSSPQHAQVAGTVSLIGVYGMSFVVNALTMPVIAIALVLFYYDQRVRKEGFDIELLMQQAGMVIEPPAQPEPAAWIPVASQTTEAEPVKQEAPTEAGAAEEAPAEPAGGSA